MKTKKLFLLLLVTGLSIGVKAQNSVTTNKIISTENYLFGVQSESGELLIDTIYGQIRMLYDNSKLTLPPSNKRPTPKPVEYYLVSDTERKKALFDKDGNLVFGFKDCFALHFDEHTKSVVALDLKPTNSTRSYLYNLNGELLFNTDFESVAFIKNADLIALIVEDGANDEYYLYNPFTKEKTGPFDHFNIFNEDSQTPMGMKEDDFEKYKGLNLITVRKTINNDYVWGVMDLKGNELLPVSYDYLRMIPSDMLDYIEKCDKPEAVDFLFHSRQTSQSSYVLLIDKQMRVYEMKRLNNGNGTITAFE